QQPHRSVMLPPNAPPALMIGIFIFFHNNHPPVPVDQFLGLPHNLIECHECCAWRAALAPHPQPPPMQHPQPVPVPPLQPPIQPCPQLPAGHMGPEGVWHGDFFYEGAAQHQPNWYVTKTIIGQ
ncbi:hypothetical protein PAXRUDRAFT_156528, partial [Paxillus rubicundulus Ve08.2h10]